MGLEIHKVNIITLDFGDSGLPECEEKKRYMKDKTILLIGATQGTGLEAARKLASDGTRIRVLARNIAKARENYDETVPLVKGDLQDKGQPAEAFEDIDHIIFTAGVTKRPCSEDLIVSTEFEGMKRVLAAAKAAGFCGRFAFLSSIGVENPNWASALLNKIKGNALKWRLAMEDLIRESGIDYTIVRAGYLMNSVSNKRIQLGQNDLALQLRYRIGRKEAARVLVESLRHEEAGGKTFYAVRSNEAGVTVWSEAFNSLRSDDPDQKDE